MWLLQILGIFLLCEKSLQKEGFYLSDKKLNEEVKNSVYFKRYSNWNCSVITQEKVENCDNLKTEEIKKLQKTKINYLDLSKEVEFQFQNVDIVKNANFKNGNFVFRDSFMGLENVFVNKKFLDELLFGEDDEVTEEINENSALNTDKLQRILQKLMGPDNFPSMKNVIDEFRMGPQNKINQEKSENKPKEVFLEECRCTKKIYGNDIQDFNTCSSSSLHRGKGQKVISYSFYGRHFSEKEQERLYFTGIWNNLLMIKKHYPDWTMRLYHNLGQKDSRHEALCFLTCHDPDFDLCDVKNLPNLGDATDINRMNWRFLPLLDHQVTHFMSRDLDSGIIEREKLAVEEWLKSEKNFHVMRDHPHHKFVIPGGLWGAKLYNERVRKALITTFFEASKDKLFWTLGGYEEYGRDQDLLTKYFWPWVKYDNLSHDSYSCTKYEGLMRPFSSQRPTGKCKLVGCVITRPMKFDKTKICPLECRGHPNWEFC